MKMILLSMLLLSFSLVYAAPLGLADAKTLEARFIAAGFKHFIDATDIISKLTEEELKIRELHSIVDNAIHAYGKYINDESFWVYNRAKILELIVVDCPAYHKELREISGISRAAFLSLIA